jgi:hypothetical protein
MGCAEQRLLNICVGLYSTRLCWQQPVSSSTLPHAARLHWQHQAHHRPALTVLCAACVVCVQAGTHPNTLLQLPARVSHLSGTGCIPQSSRALHGGNSSSCSSDGGGSSSMSDHSKHTATKVRHGRGKVAWLTVTGLIRQNCCTEQFPLSRMQLMQHCASTTRA